MGSDRVMEERMWRESGGEADEVRKQLATVGRTLARTQQRLDEAVGVLKKIDEADEGTPLPTIQWWAREAIINNSGNRLHIVVGKYGPDPAEDTLATSWDFHLEGDGRPPTIITMDEGTWCHLGQPLEYRGVRIHVFR